jgi:hypothetical protein
VPTVGGASGPAVPSTALQSHNTSTDSANTVITMVTVEDASSLDDPTIRITANLIEDHLLLDGDADQSAFTVQDEQEWNAIKVRQRADSVAPISNQPLANTRR